MDISREAREKNEIYIETCPVTNAFLKENSLAGVEVLWVEVDSYNNANSVNFLPEKIHEGAKLHGD